MILILTPEITITEPTKPKKTKFSFSIIALVFCLIVWQLVKKTNKRIILMTDMFFT